MSLSLCFPFPAWSFPGGVLFIRTLCCSIFSAVCIVPFLAAQAPASATPNRSTPVTASVYLRERTNVTQWFAATTNAEEYAHQDSLLRIAIAQRIKHYDYQLELSNSTELALPIDAVSAVAAQGQLGLGGTYYASNNNNMTPVAASFKTGWLRYHFKHDANTLQIGRFEFFEGQETTPKNTTLGWLQTNRIGQRLIGNFGFSNGQRSFDGLTGKMGGANWDLTAMAGRATQGVFNMNANPELNVDLQYVGYSRYLAKQRVLLRGFGMAYHDGRTGLTKTDNRTAAARALDHKNIRLATYGGDMIAAIPVAKNTFELLLWGAGQSGSWGLLGDSAGAIAVEGGLRLDGARTKPWLRGGYFRSTGDNNNTDGTHNTFFQVLPTPRVYARFPYFNLMNLNDSFIQFIDKPSPKIDVRTDLHFLKLTAPTDFLYGGGGAYDNKVFGYTGKPGNNHNSMSSLYDLSVDYAINKQFSLTAYYAHAFGKTVLSTIYPIHTGANYGYFELTYKMAKQLGHAPKP